MLIVYVSKNIVLGGSFTMKNSKKKKEHIQQNVYFSNFLFGFVLDVLEHGMRIL